MTAWSHDHVPQWAERIGRVGWAAKGAVHLLIGIVAFQIAIGESKTRPSEAGAGAGDEGEASKMGAVEAIADQPGGMALLVVLGVGTGLYALWRLVAIWLPGDGSMMSWLERAGYLISAGLYGLLSYSAFAVALTSRDASSSGESSAERISRQVLEAPGGRWLLGLGAVVALVVAARHLTKVTDASFMDGLDLSDESDRARRVIERLGRAGWVGRAASLGLISLFVLVAALTHDADDAKGLDAALRDLAEPAWGAAVVAFVAVALMAYGAFAVVSSPYRELQGPGG